MALSASRSGSTTSGQIFVEVIVVVPILIIVFAVLYQLILDYQAVTTTNYAAWRGVRAATALIPRQVDSEPAYVMGEGGTKWQRVKTEVVHSLIPISASLPLVTWLSAQDDAIFLARLGMASLLGGRAGFYLSRYTWATSHTQIKFLQRDPKTGQYHPLKTSPEDNLYHFAGADEDITLQVTFTYQEIFPVRALAHAEEGTASGSERTFVIETQMTLPLQGEMFPHTRPQLSEVRDETPH